MDRDLNPSRNLDTSSPSATLNSSIKTAEDRAAFIKQQAEQRMAERLAALGLKPPAKTGESLQQKQERDDRLRQAEAEDAKRDEERHRRLAGEKPAPPIVSKSLIKKPPPPPSRGSRAGSLGQPNETKRKAEEKALQVKFEQERKEKVIKQREEVKEDIAQELECVTTFTSREYMANAIFRDSRDRAQSQEDDLARERAAAETRLKVLQEQYDAGKLKKQEEKKRKQASEKAAKEKEAKLVAQRAELEAAKERERKLQMQLESLSDEESSDDEGSGERTPNESTPIASQIISTDVPLTHIATSPVARSIGHSRSPASPSNLPVPSVQSSSSFGSETKNPFFKQLSQSIESSPGNFSQQISLVNSPSAAEVSTNPFHKITQQESSAKTVTSLSSTPTTSRPSRVRPEEDEWSVVDSTEDSSEEESEDKPTGGSAKQLASMLFGTMGPPRPQSAMDDGKSPVALNPDTAIDLQYLPTESESRAAPAESLYEQSPIPSGNEHPVPPPLPPPLPGLFDSPPISLPPPPPPPPPPIPGASGDVLQPSIPPQAADGGKPAVGALLGEIQHGARLRKVETKDRSQSSVAGRVLN